MRLAIKTATYAVTHFIVAIAVAYALTRDWRIALAIGLIEPAAQTVAYFFTSACGSGSRPAPAKPIVLTAAAAMIGAATIISDPINQGLAFSLLFGLASSTLLTVLVIPAIYVLMRGEKEEPAMESETEWQPANA